MISVITTIAEPTECVQKLVQYLQPLQSLLVVVGDKKGPKKFDLDGSFFLPLDAQLKLPFKLAQLVPTAHYARKNLGYLWAFSKGTDWIYETDDDNAPDQRWKPRASTVQAKPIRHSGWVNVYRYFSDDKLMWPRGLPLNKIRDESFPLDLSKIADISVTAPVQQGLADGSPDVDAVWRLVCDRPFNFKPGPEIYLEPGAWCPFNSQNTWWRPEAYPLMYLPSFCSFRMTDIWRSFVTQRCLWAMGKGVLFFGADVVQERNVHNLQKDFEAEVPGYTGNERLVEVLSQLSLREGAQNVTENLMQCYEALVRHEFFPATELELLNAWIADCQAVLEK